MRLIFAIYTSQFYKDIHLPAIDNQDYDLILGHQEYGLEEDLVLKLEVVDGIWRFHGDSKYRVFLEGRSFEEEPLQVQKTLQIQSGKGEQLILFIWQKQDSLMASKKYQVLSDEIVIGKMDDCDITYDAVEDNSRYHAVIRYSKEQIFVKDTSTNGTYLNGQRIIDETEVRFGNRINLYGMSIICLGKYIAVNSLLGEISINEKKLCEVTELEEEEKTYVKKGVVPAESIVHISPRNLPRLYDGEEVIENVPQKKEEDNKPAWMSILPSLTMVLPMLLGYGLMSNGNMSMGLVISGGAAIVGVTWSAINLRYSRKKVRDEELKRLRKYEEYLIRRADAIREKFDFNRKAILEQYPDAVTSSMYTENSASIWTRKTNHSDFLFIRLGLGSMPFQVKIKVPSKSFSLVDDELSERPAKIAQNYENMNQIPLGILLTEHNVVGVLTGNNLENEKNIERLIITQIVANHCYTDVKIVMLHDEQKELDKKENGVRWLPHIWNEDRTIRYFSMNESQAGDVLFVLSQIVRARSERIKERDKKNSLFPHYVLFVENMRFLEGHPIVKYLYENGRNLGITTILMADEYENLPSACDYVIQCDDVFSGMFAIKEGGDIRQNIEFDTISTAQMDKMARNMSGMRVNQIESSSDIPSSLTFFEMMGIHCLEELNVMERWKKNRTFENMQALIGQKAGGQNCFLDINEKYHGPHGLVAGTTGSGKSETLQTYILSLAVNFSPQDVGLFIIDYKGGGMGNLFAGLPHTLGVISNLSGNQVRRAMVSISSEIKRRQRIFGDFGVNHIDGYTKLVKNREASIPIPHLLIIIDEFAELKREEPEFMKKLVSVAQVGRSLGVHLILATQKPSGTVDDNIWSNTKFKLCLRVADKQDSNDMLHRPDAAYLTQAGRCYLQVGNNEIFELFQSGWSGAVYDETEDSSLTAAALIDQMGHENNSGRRIKSEKKRKASILWMTRILDCVKQVLEQNEKKVCELSKEDLKETAKEVIALLNVKEECYPENNSNIRKLENVIQNCPDELTDTGVIAEWIIETFQMQGRILPEKQEKTQLNAIVNHLAVIASQSGMENKQMLWMPVLPKQLGLEDIPDYKRIAFGERKWDTKKEFQLAAYIGLVDDPENQIQFPLIIDLAERGHLLAAGNVTSGKSTFLQTLLYSLISTYTPAELNIYAIDFSSQMLCPFERDAHVGGVVIEGEDDRLNKLFGMISEMLQMRKKQIRGGNFNQYIQVHGNILPAVVLVIDGYANFREKTGNRFESNLLELSRIAEGYGIYLVISCASIGSSDLQSKIADNFRQKICLEMGDKFGYGIILGNTRFDILPEINVKGRGLASIDGNILEYQTALAYKADNDYSRSEWIQKQCKFMSDTWSGKCASAIPEIPEKPVWESFRELARYGEIIEEKRYLPVGYYQETAALYGIDLQEGYKYLVLGREHIGKSVFMRNIACAAKDTGGQILIIDDAKYSDRKTAELTGAEYAAEQSEIRDMVKKLILMTNERARRKKELIGKGYDDEDIYRVISNEFQSVFVLIMNFEEFLNTIYSFNEGLGKMNTQIETIFAKAQLLNFYFFAAANRDQVKQWEGYLAFRNFAAEQRGVVLGGELNKQSVFSCKYAVGQDKRLKAGNAYAFNNSDDNSYDLVVFPQNKGLVDG